MFQFSRLFYVSQNHKTKTFNTFVDIRKYIWLQQWPFALQKGIRQDQNNLHTLVHCIYAGCHEWCTRFIIKVTRPSCKRSYGNEKVVDKEIFYLKTSFQVKDFFVYNLFISITSFAGWSGNLNYESSTSFVTTCVNAMNECMKIILVLSDSFLKSEWPLLKPYVLPYIDKSIKSFCLVVLTDIKQPTELKQLPSVVLIERKKIPLEIQKLKILLLWKTISSEQMQSLLIFGRLSDTPVCCVIQLSIICLWYIPVMFIVWLYISNL